MFIKSIKISGFKCFPEKEEVIEFKLPMDDVEGSGLNTLVGKNNSGKSTVFEAIDFLRNGASKDLADLRNKNIDPEAEFFVELEFVGKIRDVITNFSEKKLDDYMENLSGKTDEQRILVRRSSKTYKIQQNKKEVEITPKKVCLWNFVTSQFENPSGLDADFKKLFELDFIWADTNPEDITKFGSTTICGKLLSKIVKAFKDKEEYKNFSNAHHTAFNDPTSGLKKELDNIEKRTKDVFKGQFGDADIKFHFDLVDIDSFFKNTKIKISDGKMETYLDENGSGMQRSVALALLQVYAEDLVKHPENDAAKKPFYLFIDEPEICLHPQAQKKLLFALKQIARRQQVFITTHSPYFIDPEFIENIYKFDKTQSGITVTTLDTNGDFGKKEKGVLDTNVKEIFFADKVLCVEGKVDVKRVLKFLEAEKIDVLSITVIKMHGKQEMKKYKKIFSAFVKDYQILLDLDAICAQKETGGLKCDLFSDETGIENKIVSLAKTKRSDLVSSVLNEEEKKLKEEILSELYLKNIFVLSEGEIEDYLDSFGAIVLPSERRDELVRIFSLF